MAFVACKVELEGIACICSQPAILLLLVSSLDIGIHMWEEVKVQSLLSVFRY